jgi:copper chaperone NosL
MSLSRALLGLAVILGGCSATACTAQADGPPAIVLDRDACSHCGMLISEARHAAAFRAPDGATRVFDDIGCLRDAAGGATAGLRVWVHDTSDESWLDAGEATFVVSPDIRTPMAGGVAAFRHAADAERAATKYRGRVVRSVTNLLSTGKGSGS